MAGQNNCTEKPDSPHRTSGEGDFDLLALIARLVERPGPPSATDPEDGPADLPEDDPADGRRMSPETIGRVLAALVEQSLPGGVLVTTSDDFERARERAYAQGWQDAVQHTAVHIPSRPAPEPRPVDAANEGTVIAFPPRIPLVRAADTASGRELMPHRPRRPRKPPKQP